MRHLLEDYERVSEETPCPKCGSPDWCLIHRSGRKCICQRVERGGIPRGEAGYLHYLPEGERVPINKPAEPKTYLAPNQIKAYLAEHDGAENMLEHQAHLLGLPVSSIKAFQAHYESQAAALIFPMYDEHGHVCGCRLRRSDGRKWSLKGGREGVFLPHGSIVTGQPIFIAEGPTDAAAAYSLGFHNVIGRPSCTGGVRIICHSFLLRNALTPVVIFADPKPQELDGATKLAMQLPNPCVVIVGPTDLREFVIKTDLQSDARRGILEGLTDCERPIWRDIYRNQPGKFYPFDRLFKVRQAA